MDSNALLFGWIGAFAALNGLISSRLVRVSIRTHPALRPGFAVPLVALAALQVVGLEGALAARCLGDACDRDPLGMAMALLVPTLLPAVIAVGLSPASPGQPRRLLLLATTAVSLALGLLVPGTLLAMLPLHGDSSSWSTTGSGFAIAAVAFLLPRALPLRPPPESPPARNRAHWGLVALAVAGLLAAAVVRRHTMSYLERYKVDHCSFTLFAMPGDGSCLPPDWGPP